MSRLPLVLSAAALAVALLGATPLGEAARDILPIARYAKNSDKVDGFNASRIPRPGYLVPLGPNGRFPQAVGQVGPPGPPGLGPDRSRRRARPDRARAHLRRHRRRLVEPEVGRCALPTGEEGARRRNRADGERGRQPGRRAGLAPP